MIRLEHIRKEYPGVVPLADVSAEIRDGDVISVIGPSGTGKSTLLRCINMLEIPTSGRIWLDETEITAPGCDLSKVRQKMGMVFQSFHLFSHLSVIENLMLAPIDLLGQSRQEAYDKGLELLKTVGLVDKAKSYPDQLSGGQKQRVAIARTLAMGPEIILFDEPTSALDPAMVGEVQAVIRELSRSGKTMMIVTHEMEFARSICNRVFYMDEGGIYEEGPPEQVFQNPVRERTRRFIRRLQILELVVDSRNYDFAAVESRIREHCSKQHLSPSLQNRLQLVFEELVHQQLVRGSGLSTIKLLVEIPQEQNSCTVTICYGGEKHNVLEDADPLSRKVLEGLASELRHEWNEEKKLQNAVIISLRV
jgi:polar amino acid transport system ATP-binding protein